MRETWGEGHRPSCDRFLPFDQLVLGVGPEWGRGALGTKVAFDGPEVPIRSLLGCTWPAGTFCLACSVVAHSNSLSVPASAYKASFTGPRSLSVDGTGQANMRVQFSEAPLVRCSIPEHKTPGTLDCKCVLPIWGSPFEKKYSHSYVVSMPSAPSVISPPGWAVRTIPPQREQSQDECDLLWIRGLSLTWSGSQCPRLCGGGGQDQIISKFLPLASGDSNGTRLEGRPLGLRAACV